MIAADGIKSQAKELVLGFKDEPHSSGYAVYRAFLEDASELHKDPRIKDLLDNQGHCWIG